MEETTAFMINDILEDIFSGEGIAGKTGTTNLTKADRERWNLPSGTSSKKRCKKTFSFGDKMRVSNSL